MSTAILMERVDAAWAVEDPRIADALRDQTTAGHWQELALCRKFDPDLWFPFWQDLASAAMAQAICASCPVRRKCFDEAVSSNQTSGIWGGHDFDAVRMRYAARLSRQSPARRRRSQRRTSTRPSRSKPLVAA